jgi:polysaccharide biosynthesis/export protein
VSLPPPVDGYFCAKSQGMGRYLGVIALALTVFAGCNINRDIMFKTPTDYEYETFTDTATVNFRIQPNDIITFRLFANKGFKMIDLIDDQGALRNNNRQIFNYTVNPDGTAKLPLVGAVPVTGMTVREAEAALEELYTQYYNDPFVQLSVTNRRVIVFPGGGGDAKVVTLENTNTTILEALAQAAGVAKRGDVRKVKLFRRKPGGGRSIYQFDMSDINGLPEADLIVQADDIIYVQPNPQLANELLANLNPFIALLTSTVLVIGIVRGFGN